MASHAVINVTEQTFDAEVLQASVPVLVDFWAEWCGPCKMLGPVLDEVSREQGPAVKITKVNIEEEPKLAEKYGISSVPSLFYFHGGQLVQKSVGVTPKSQIIQKLESLK